ncbi:hypothetical protein FMUND_13023 [Fusarium mundagurra]|uniref:Uncharacterized protein n=1 Tax=Fusarium mundagurra TaxID=1567541 RepID=A0A8H5Y0M8_9HYPO|nr:hypothetical protein FMUND_13023 [Fusarium mundagurra]
MASFKLHQFLSVLCLLFTFSLARPLDANGSLQPRQTVCRTGFGCLGFGVSGWNSFLLDIPAASDPHTHHAISTGRVTEGNIWTKGDGGAFFWISVVEGYRPPPGQRVEVRAWVGSTQLNLNNSEVHELQSAIATIPADVINRARSSMSRPAVKIEWRIV